MSKGPKTNVTTQATAPDTATQGYRNAIWGAAGDAANQPAAGMNPLTTQAAGLFGDYANAGATGAAALGGDPAATAKLWNPYQSQVLDSIQNQFSTLAGRARNAVGSNATMAGAYGGTRHGVAEGVAIGELGRTAQEQLANTASSGYDTMMNRAYMGANLGFGAAGQLSGLGQYMTQYADQNNPAMRRLGLLTGAMGAMGPGGQTTTTTEPINRNRAAGALGGATTGAEIGSHFGPWGTGIGAGLGGLIGMFG